MIDLETIARTCHETRRALCEAFDEAPLSSWDNAPEWQRECTRLDVQLHQNNDDFTAKKSHENWMEHKFQEGWTYGPIKDADAKTHPWLIPFDELPPEQQAKDYIARAIVDALSR